MQERIAKVIARAGCCSRRDAEKLIFAGKVAVNGKVIDSPALKILPDDDVIEVCGKKLDKIAPPRLWMLHKIKGVVTSNKDERGRKTIFDILPANLPRVVTIGRLDINTEGLLLLTNDGKLARKLEHPDTGLAREYRVRAYGEIDDKLLAEVRKGVTVEGIKYRPVQIKIEKKQGDNMWLRVILTEGKNREIKKLLSYIGLRVNRLIRVSYGEFKLGNLKAGAVIEVIPFQEGYKVKNF